MLNFSIWVYFHWKNCCLRKLASIIDVINETVELRVISTHLLWWLPDQPRSCSFTQLGHEYIGVTSQASDGTPCQRWSDQPDQLLRGYYFGSETVEQAQNYCRNPKNDSTGLWCLADSTGTLQFCSQIPKCGLYDCLTNCKAPCTMPVIK